MSERYKNLPIGASFFISSAGKIGSVQEFKIKISSSCFVANDSRVKIV